MNWDKTSKIIEGERETHILRACHSDLARRASICVCEMAVISIESEDILRYLMQNVVVLSHERIPDL